MILSAYSKGRITEQEKHTRQSDLERYWRLHSPPQVSGLVLAAGTGMLGALISDIDVGTSKSHKDADRITLIAVLLVAAEIALNYFYDFSIWEKIRNDQSMAPVAMGVIIFIAVCAFGKNQPHRSFMHSIMAMAILSGALSHGICTAGTLLCDRLCVPSDTGLF